MSWSLTLTRSREGCTVRILPNFTGDIGVIQAQIERFEGLIEGFGGVQLE